MTWSPSSKTSSTVAWIGPASRSWRGRTAPSRNACLPWNVPEIGVDPITVHVTSSETTSKNGWKSPCSQAAKASAISVPLPPMGTETEGSRPPPAQRPADGHDDRLPAEHGPHLPAGLAHRPEQAELPRPLVDRQGQRVGDAHQGDEDRQGQQHVDDAEHHVDPLGGRLDVAGPVLY